MQALKAYLISALTAEALYQSSFGAKPDYNLDGESYQWMAWRAQTVALVKQLGELIQLEAGPFEVISLAR